MEEKAALVSFGEGRTSPHKSLNKKKIPLVISFSGGRTSAYMCWVLLNDPEYRDKYEFIFIFANTGKEKEETLIFVDQCDKYFGLNLVWVEALVHPEKGVGTTHRIVNFETASRKGEPFKDVIRKYSITNAKFPHCTRELKQRPIASYTKSVVGSNQYVTAIGIRIDEMRRAKQHDERLIYPLTTSKHMIGEAGVRKFWHEMPFDLKLKSYQGNCDLCWKKSANKKMQIIREQPEVAEWWIEMEDEFSGYSPASGKTGEFFFHRGNESTRSLVARAHLGEEVTDPHHIDNQGEACTCRGSFVEEGEITEDDYFD